MKKSHEEARRNMAEEVERNRQQEGYEERPGGIKFEVHAREEEIGPEREWGKRIERKEDGEKERPSLEEITRCERICTKKLGETSDYAIQKAGQTKETIKQGVQTTDETAAEKARQGQKGLETTKDYTVPTAKQAKDYVTHFTEEKAAQATKAMAGVAVAAKDKMVGAGQTVVGYTESKLVPAKDAVVASEESAAEYAARKKAEAQRDFEEKKSSTPAKAKPTEKAQEFVQGRHAAGEMQRGEQEGGGVLHAIGETLVEIGQTTTDLLVGQGLPGQYSYLQEEESHDREGQKDQSQCGA
ncbi:hypothetical protein ACH5RR_028632 [Cinchona calisaya]|uniref:Seed biotin-containing protein SBP65 n=1 Tax=Cinchona calisaya TaxID=153742 RepID=A0ABD2YRJ6_9GENT